MPGDSHRECDSAELTFREITFGSAGFLAECQLREEVLRAPLGLSLQDEALDWEKDQLHYGLFAADGSLVACVIAVPLSESDARIRQMAVAPRHQGQGHGNRLFRALEQDLARRGFRHLELHARKEAVGFYEKLGFAVQGDEYLEVGIPHRTMAKNLPPNS